MVIARLSASPLDVEQSRPMPSVLGRYPFDGSGGRSPTRTRRQRYGCLFPRPPR